jgi:hypothetical protein
MLAEADLQEYLEEIRQEVCSRCVERPPGGPPCGPLGKPCGVELHLPQLIEAVKEVHSELIDPYLDHNRAQICQGCAFLHSDFCPCPMDTLAVLVVQAIEAVDERRQRRQHGRDVMATLPGLSAPGLRQIARAYEEASGTWTGCDWPMTFGRAHLDLEGCPAAQAEARAVETAGTEGGESWSAAAHWLAEVERRARRAETRAEEAVKAANDGRWDEAVRCARQAWALEFSTGRPFRNPEPVWQPLLEVIEAAARGEPAADEGP